MGLLEDYFVPLHNFYLTPDSFDQKVRVYAVSILGVARDTRIPVSSVESLGRSLGSPACPENGVVMTRDPQERKEPCGQRLTHPGVVRHVLVGLFPWDDAGLHNCGRMSVELQILPLFVPRGLPAAS